jgi:hypothetical protein
MDKLKHTPGPWRVDNYTNCIEGSDDLTVAHAWYDTRDREQAHANAPDLLEALQRILPFVDCIAAITREDINEYEQAYKDAIAAIAKAEGLNKATGETK